MKLNALSVANALAVTTGIFYIGCRLFVGLFPSLTVSIIQSWFHSITLTQVNPSSLTMSDFFIGLVSLTISAWITGYVFVKTYNLMKS